MVQGIDVSHFTNNIDWTSLHVGFVFMKATQGTSFEDPTFSARWQAAKLAGIIRGAYHFWDEDADPLEQASYFSNIVGALDPSDLIAIDLEVDGADPSQVQIFLNSVESLCGKTPIIYTSPYYASEMNLSSDFAKYPLWIAHYDVKSPTVPAPWQNWTFWQFTDAGPVPGVDTPCDVNYFNGSLDKLKALPVNTTSRYIK